MEQRFAIFDMDGTLVDSMMYWHNLGQEYLESKGVKGDLNEVLERSKPMTMVESGALFIQEFGLAGTPESVAAEINAVMEDHYRNHVELKEGAKEYLEQLQLQQGEMVDHTAFGRGMVLSVRPMGGDALVEVAFDKVGTKKLMLKSAGKHMKKV